MWSLMLSDARIAWRSSSVRITTFAGRLRLGTFGSLMPAVSTRAIRRVVFPTVTTSRFLFSSWLRAIASPAFARRRISFILSMSMPSSPSSALYASKAPRSRVRSTIATCAGSTAFTVIASFPTLNFASSTRVETTSTTSLRTSALTFPSNKRVSPKISPGEPVTCYKGSRARSDSVFPPRVLALHAPIDARRRLVRGPRLPHDPERLIVPALRTLDPGLRQCLRDLVEDQGLRRLLLSRPRDLRDRAVLPGERALVSARVAVQPPLLGKHQG